MIGRDQVLLLDLWGKLAEPGAVFADITWVGFTGSSVPDEPARAFDAIARARDAAVALVEEAAMTGRELHGWEVDRAARDRARAVGLSATTSCTAPVTASARACMETACTWMTTRRTTSGGFCRAPASRLSRACISRPSAFARKSMFFGEIATRSSPGRARWLS